MDGTASQRKMDKRLGKSDLRNRMKKAKADHPEPAVDRDLYSGMMRLHVLHHASQG